MKLTHNGHARHYWNGQTWIEFKPDGTYEATEAEAAVLLNCQGVSKAIEPLKDREFSIEIEPAEIAVAKEVANAPKKSKKAK